MAEGWIRHHAAHAGVPIDVHSAGSERTRVKDDAITVMHEAGIDLRTHTSKTADELPDPWSFDLVITVCDSAHEACPNYPARTQRAHVSFEDPSGQPLEKWREVRDALARMSERLIAALASGRLPSESELTEHPPVERHRA